MNYPACSPHGHGTFGMQALAFTGENKYWYCKFITELKIIIRKANRA